MKFERTTVHNIEGAIYDMRMPFLSHDKSDSYTDEDGNYIIGRADMKLAKKLIKGGGEHSKFLRSIYIDTIITAPQYWIAEQDTYKIATVRNSSSLMHLGTSRDFTLDDFTLDDDKDNLLKIIDVLNEYRRKYIETQDYKYFRILRQLMPMGYNYTYSWSTSYSQLQNIYQQRVKHPHRLKEWTEDFAQWVESLPYAKELIIREDNNNGTESKEA